MFVIRKFRHYLSRTSARRPMVWYRHRWLQAEDVLIASYPRSGNTWLRFLLFELLTGQPATFETINRPDSPVPDIIDYRRSPSLLPKGGRLVKTHEPYRQEYRKAIYLVRDVRDVVISEYNYVRWLGVYDKDFHDFLRRFLVGHVNGYGTWYDHVNSWLNADIARNSRLLLVRFEDMRQDSEGTLAGICNFLGLPDDMETIRDAIRHNAIEIMRQKEELARRTVLKEFRQDVNFVSRGMVEGWRQTLTGSQARLIEQYAGEVLSRLGYRVSRAIC